MNNTIQQQVFNNLMESLNIQVEPRKSNVELFDEWMRTKVKSIYYGDNELMLMAYDRIFD